MIDTKTCLIAAALLLAAFPAGAQTDNPDKAPPPAPAASASGTVIPVVGRSVHDAEGNDVGRLWDVLVDTQGVPHMAVIDYGGVLGVGKRKIAVPWPALNFGATPSDPLTLSLTREQMGAIPDFQYSGGADAATGGAGGSK